MKDRLVPLSGAVIIALLLPSLLDLNAKAAAAVAVGALLVLSLLLLALDRLVGGRRSERKDGDQ